MQRIARIEYVVEPADRTWTVAWQHRRIGAFENRRSALKAALDDARRVRSLGHDIRVLARRQDGSLRPVPERLLLSR